MAPALMSRPTSIRGPQTQGCWLRISLSPSVIRRVASRINAKVWSAEARSRTPGVLVTVTPAVYRGRQIDIVVPDRDVRDDLQLRPGGGQQIGIDALGQCDDGRARTADAPASSSARSGGASDPIRNSSSQRLQVADCAVGEKS